MRVLAIQSIKNGVMHLFGEGKLLGEKIPDIEPYSSGRIPNPCIKLDSGKYIWGMQCWWGDAEKLEKRYEGHIKERVLVEEFDEILPLENGHDI